MRKLFFTLFVVASSITITKAQVGIGTQTPNPSAMLEVVSKSKGVLITRMTQRERNAILTPATGLLIYQTDLLPGFYYFTGTEWRFLTSGLSGTANRITVSPGISPAIDIASTYVGQSSITTLGTISTGTWNASVIPATKGGAGNINGLLKANGAGTVSAALKGTDYSAPLKLTTTGTIGAATYNATTGALNIPIYAGVTGTSYTFNSPLALSGTSVSIPIATSTVNGYLTSTDWSTFNNKLSAATAASTYAPINSPTFTGTVSGINKSMVGLGSVDNTTDLNKPISIATQTALGNKITSNTPITGETKTKITYDSKGLVISGADASTSDITEGANLYFTENRTLNTILNNFQASTNEQIQSTDNILSAFSKVQGQINSLTKIPSGNSKGDMLFWNGTEWEKITGGSERQSLVFCNGIPTWGGNFAQLSINPISDINAFTAKFSGSVIDDGCTNIIDKGIVWNTSPNPTIANSKWSFGREIGSFSGMINGLSMKTSYYLKAYAINQKGISYSDELSFQTTDLPVQQGTVTDIDGNIYKTVIIGNKEWMAENLNVSKYRNGEQIQVVTDYNDWIASDRPLMCYYNNDVTNATVWGGLYNWFAATDVRAIAPEGWHVATYDELQELESMFGGRYLAGGALKEAGLANWLSPNVGATNEVGFSALPGGLRGKDQDFVGLHSVGTLWTTTPAANVLTAAYGVYFWHSNSEFQTYDSFQKRGGLSIRCVRNYPNSPSY